MPTSSANIPETTVHLLDQSAAVVTSVVPINTHHDQPVAPAPESVYPPPPSLPNPSPIAEASFSWGNVDSSTFIDHMNEVYSEVVHWKMNLPFGSVSLVNWLAIQIHCKYIALKSTTVLSALALQKPYIC